MLLTEEEWCVIYDVLSDRIRDSDQGYLIDDEANYDESDLATIKEQIKQIKVILAKIGSDGRNVMKTWFYRCVFKDGSKSDWQSVRQKTPAEAIGGPIADWIKTFEWRQGYVNWMFDPTL